PRTLAARLWAHIPLGARQPAASSRYSRLLGQGMERQTYALKLSYDGSAFRGWQRQPGQATVQEAVEGALASLLGERVRVDGAARTDAGVHAEGQVASFSLHRALDPPALAVLPVPAGLRVLAAAATSRSF